MLRAKVFVSFCFAYCIAIRDAQLTPIVTLPPEVVSSTSTTTESATVITTSSEIPVTSEKIASSASESFGKGFVIKLGQNETDLATTPTTLPSEAITRSESITDSTTTTDATSQPVTSSSDLSNHTDTEATTPELIVKTGSSTSPTVANYTDDVTQQTVTSQSLTLKGATEGQLNEETTVSSLPQEENQEVVNTPVQASDNTTESNKTGGSYKDKAPPEFHPYLEEILRHDEIDDKNGTSTPPPPIRIKSKGYAPSQNALPYGPLPKFEEKEMDKMRLNHWRVQQVLKGHDHTDNPKVLGQVGTGKANLQGKQFPVLGQKRASSAAATVIQSSLDQDEFHTSVLASEADAALTGQDDETSSSAPSKLRTFFNWISNPLKRKPNEEDERLKQAKAQQPILPFALGYRGDFLFW